MDITETAGTLNERQDQIVADFRRFEDGMAKYRYLIELGKKHPGLDNVWKTDDHAVPGCQSTVWLRSERQGDRLRFWADSDSLITRGILVLLLRVFDNQPAGEIADAELYFLDEIGLSAQLSPSRRNGLAVVVREIQKMGQSPQSG